MPSSLDFASVNKATQHRATTGHGVPYPRQQPRFFLIPFMIFATMFLFVSFSAYAESQLPTTAPVFSLPSEMQSNFRFPELSVSYVEYAEHRRRRFFRTGVHHLSRVVGSRPFVLLYFIPGDPVSETELQALAKACPIWKDKLSCFGVVRVRNNSMLAYLKRRLNKLNIFLPVLLDWRSVVAHAMLVQKLPSYAAIDTYGHLRLSQASSLTEYMAPNRPLLSLLQQLALNQPVPTLRAPGFSPNPYQLVGKTVSLSPITALVPPLASHKKPKPPSRQAQPTLLVFWSMQCDHCRRILPQLDAYRQKHSTGWSLFTLAWTPSSEQRQKLQTFLKLHRLHVSVIALSSVPLLQQFYVQNFPTFIMLDAQQTIRSVHLGAASSAKDILDPMLRSTGLSPH